VDVLIGRIRPIDFQVEVESPEVLFSSDVDKGNDFEMQTRGDMTILMPLLNMIWG